MEKYSKLSFIIIIFLLVFIATFIITNRNTPNKEPAPEISASEVQNSRKNQPQETRPGYLLKLEGNTLCAYRIKNGGNILLEKSAIEPLSIAAEDIENLKNGIYAKSEEEVLSFFESYTS